MNQLRNRETQREAAEVARLQDGVDKLPSLVSDTVQLVAEVNPKLLRRSNFTKNLINGNYTVPTGKKLLITGIQLAYVKDATNTGTVIGINLTMAGATAAIARLLCTTLTAEKDSIFISFPYPLESDAGAALSRTVTGTFLNEAEIVYGYLVDA